MISRGHHVQIRRNGEYHSEFAGGIDEFAALEATLASDEARTTIERVAWAICTDERQADYVIEESNHIYTPSEKTVWLIVGILLIPLGFGILILIALFKDGPLNEETHEISGRYFIAELRGLIEFECKNDVFTKLQFTRIKPNAVVGYQYVDSGDSSTAFEFTIHNGEGPNIRLWRLGGWHDGKEFGKNYPKLVDFSERTGIRLSQGMLNRFGKWIP